jgi:phosphatidylserine decarboxylase
MSFAREGMYYYGGGAFLTIMLALLGVTWLAIPMAGVTLFCLYFFRDPVRIPDGPEPSLVSPADGKIMAIKRDVEHPLFPHKCSCLCIFMSVISVHINRSPTQGKITKIEHRAGRFFPAYDDLAATQNEQNEFWIETEDRSYALIQIAGILARRIVCWLKPGDTVSRGQKIGLIQFGSRVDLYLPSNFDYSVKPGDMLKSGKTLIGSFSD